MILKKIWLNINGVDRILMCNPEKDTLADVLRRIGLTGTKVGCNKGLCGACSVLLDGKVVRSCVTKIGKVEDYSKIITIEGIGSPENLHPIQQAWITYGGVQCGFCSPGFVVSAKGLLDENPSPDRETVRDWFQKHHNICRCTGYKPLVDAVMKAAEVMRGEKTMDDITFQIPEDGRVYGTAYPRPAALSKVTGTCDFGVDIHDKMPEGTLYLAPVMPGVSHAKINGIDFAEAEKMPGVVKVVTAKDIKGSNRIMFPIGYPRSKADGFERPIICDEKVFRYGDVVAVVAANTEEQARAAAKAVKLDLEQLPEYMSYLDAIMPDAMEIHPGIPNEYIQMPVLKGKDVREVAEEADMVSVEGSFYSARQPHNVLEPESAQAYIDEDGNVTVHTKTLALVLALMTLPPGLGIDPAKFRVIENPTGASFGSTLSPSTTALAAACALAVNAPVSLRFTYEEHEHFSGKRAPAYINGRLTATNDGKLTGAEFDIAYDHGAYTEMADVLATKGIRFFGFPYDIPNVRGLARCGMTNHTFATAYRAYGIVQSYTASEALIDMMAEKLGIDPFEFRYKNIAREGADTINSYPYKEYPFEQMMDTLKPLYDKAVAHAKANSTPEKPHGVGIAWGGYNITGGGSDMAGVDLGLNPDGTITSYNTWEDQGQGADVGSLLHAHEALRVNGYNVDPSMIKLVMADTGQAPITGPAGANRSHYMAGNATLDAAKKLVDAMRKSDGTFRTYDEMVAEGIPTRYAGMYDTSSLNVDLDPNTGVGDPTPEYNYGIFLSEVEVDIATGKTTVISIDVVYDVGEVGSVQAVEGQAFGSMSHSIGMALSEDYEDIKRHNNIIACGIPQIKDIPDEMQAISIVTPRKTAPHGSVGCCEMFQSAGHVAILNAINNATGVRIYDTPARPEKLKAAIEAKAVGKDTAPDKYFLGSDLYDALEEIKENPVETNGPGIAL